MGIFSKRINRRSNCWNDWWDWFYIKLCYLFSILSQKQADFWFGVSPEGIGFIGMFINFFVASIISSMTPAPPAEVQKMVENIRIPKGSGDAISH